MELTKKQMRYFNLAEAASHTSTYNRIHIGAVIVKGNNVMSVGMNQNKSHPIQSEYNIHREFHIDDSCKHHLHAEMSAIVRIPKYVDLNGAEIYIYRKNGNDKIAMSRPCNACFNAIMDRGIKKIHYTTEYGYATETIA